MSENKVNKNSSIINFIRSIYDTDKFIGFITKVDLINHYRNKINQN